MKTIYKFPLEIKSESTVSMPRGAEIIEVGMQRGELCIWAMCDSEARSVPRTFDVVGTGHDCKELKSYTHLGTAHDTEHGFVWHVFEI